MFNHIERRLKAIEARFSAHLAPSHARSLHIGTSPEGDDITIPPKVRREPMWLLGRPGSGKSNFLNYAVRQDLRSGASVFVLDLHGGARDSLYHETLTWLVRTKRLGKRPPHIIDPNHGTHTASFDLLALGDGKTDISVIADAVTQAIAVAHGDQDLRQFPNISKHLPAWFIAARHCGLTITDIPLLLDPHDRQGVRAYVIAQLPDGYAKRVLSELHQEGEDERSKRGFRDQILGGLNRLEEFLRPPAIAAMVGDHTRTIDFAKVMDEGQIVLANLQAGDRASPRAMRLLGLLLLRTILFYAIRRKHPERTAYIYIDEAPKILSPEDMNEFVAECRKRGVVIILSHQYPRQLGERDDQLRAAVRACAATKMFFALGSHDDAEDVALDVVPLDLERPVDCLTKPTVIGNDIMTLSGSAVGTHAAESRGRAATDARSSADAAMTMSANQVAALSGAGSVQSSGLTSDPNSGILFPDLMAQTSGHASQSHRGKMRGKTRGRGASHIDGRAHADTTSSAAMRGRSHMMGQHEALAPRYETLPTSVFSRDAMTYKAAQTLKELRTGEAFIAWRRTATIVRVPLVATHDLTEQQLFDLKTRVLARSPSARPTDEVLTTIAERQARLIEVARRHGRHDDQSPNPSFTEPEPLPIIDAPEKFAQNFWKGRSPPDGSPKPKPKRPPGRRPKGELSPDHDRFRVLDGGLAPGGDGDKKD